MVYRDDLYLVMCNYQCGTTCDVIKETKVISQMENESRKGL